MLILVLAAVALGGCPKDGGSCTELKNDGRYTVEVLERWDERSSYTFTTTSESLLPPCEVEDVQLKAYDWHITRIMEHRHYTNCYYPICPDDFPTASGELPEAPYRGGGWLCVNTARKVTEDSCDAERFVGLEVVNGSMSPFDPPVKGELPPVVLFRTLRYWPDGYHDLMCDDPSTFFSDASHMTDTAGEFYKCADSWVVHLKKK